MEGPRRGRGGVVEGPWRGRGGRRKRGPAWGELSGWGARHRPSVFGWAGCSATRELSRVCLGETSPRDAALTQPEPWAPKVSSNLSQFRTFQSTKSLSQIPWVEKQLVLTVPLPLISTKKIQ